MSTTTLRLRNLPRFPARISGTNGVITERDSGSADLIVKNDFSNLIRIPAVDNTAKTFFLSWNADLDSYSILSFEDLFASTAGSGFMAESVYDPAGHAADAFARANHTGVQAISTITGLQAALNASLSPYAVKTGNYTVLLADNNAEHRYTAAATATLTAAATLGAGWHYTVMADGGAVTIDPNASETINGLTTLVVPNGSSVRIVCDGTNFFAVFKPATWEPIGVYDFTGLGTAGQLVQNLGAFRDLRYRVDFSGSGSNGMAMQFSDNNGSSFVTSANYIRAEISFLQIPSGAVSGAASSDTAVALGSAFPAAGNALIARGELVRFNKATNKVLDGSWHSNNGATSGNITFKMGYLLTMTNTFNALKFYATSGTVDGRFVLEGIRG